LGAEVTYQRGICEYREFKTSDGCRCSNRIPNIQVACSSEDWGASFSWLIQNKILGNFGQSTVLQRGQSLLGILNLLLHL
jgi:hypothetical protein